MAARNLHVGGNLSPQAHAGWHDFARDQGVNVVALLEAMGQQLTSFDQDSRLPSWLRTAVKDARTIGYERARRSKP